MTRVLLVEPDARLATVYKGALQIGGYEMSLASNAQDAVIEADQATPDVVLLELQLTAHSGIEFLYEFRSYADWRAVPVVVQSHVPPAEFDKSRKLLYDQLGVVTYLYKPHTSLQAMIAAVQKAAQKVRQ